MDLSTPPSLRSNPIRSSSRLAPRINNTLVKTNADSPIPSLDLVLSSPKSSNDTPYPSPASLCCSPSSSPVTLREILLLSPSPLRKSRTRLANRFEVEAAEAAAAARRCKTKGGQNGSASPRNCRRSRRRSEEPKPVAVLTEEKATRPRKHKKTGRSKKEKQSSVPLLPSPCPSSDLSEAVCRGDLERIRESINDLIMWRDVAKSTLWFGFGCLCFLSSCFTKGFSFRLLINRANRAKNRAFLQLKFKPLCLPPKQDFLVKQKEKLRCMRRTIRVALSVTAQRLEFNGHKKICFPKASFTTKRHQTLVRLRPSM